MTLSQKLKHRTQLAAIESDSRTYDIWEAQLTHGNHQLGHDLVHKKEGVDIIQQKAKIKINSMQTYKAILKENSNLNFYWKPIKWKLQRLKPLYIGF